MSLAQVLLRLAHREPVKRPLLRCPEVEGHLLYLCGDDKQVGLDGSGQEGAGVVLVHDGLHPSQLAALGPNHWYPAPTRADGNHPLLNKAPYDLHLYYRERPG